MIVALSRDAAAKYKTRLFSSSCMYLDVSAAGPLNHFIVFVELHEVDASESGRIPVLLSTGQA